MTNRLNNTIVIIMLIFAAIEMGLALVESIKGDISEAIICMCIAYALKITAQIMRGDLLNG